MTEVCVVYSNPMDEQIMYDKMRNYYSHQDIGLPRRETNGSKNYSVKTIIHAKIYTFKNIKLAQTAIEFNKNNQIHMFILK